MKLSIWIVVVAIAISIASVDHSILRNNLHPAVASRVAELRQAAQTVVSFVQERWIELMASSPTRPLGPGPVCAHVLETVAVDSTTEPPPVQISKGDAVQFSEFVIYDASAVRSDVHSSSGVLAASSVTASDVRDLDVSSLAVLHRQTHSRHHEPRVYQFTAGGVELLPCLSAAALRAHVGSVVTVYCCSGSAFGSLGFAPWNVLPDRDVVISFGPLSKAVGTDTREKMGSTERSVPA